MAAKLRFLTKPLTLLSLFLILLLIPTITLYTLHHPFPTPNPSHYHSLFLSSSSNATLSTYLRHLTLHPHLAGTPQSLPLTSFLLSQFKSLNLYTQTSNHTVLLSYPKYTSLTAHFTNHAVKEFNLHDGDNITPPYHAYSPSGSVFGQAVYVNYGRKVDYLKLEMLKVNVSGCVVVVRRGGGLSRGGVVEVAKEKGALGVVMFTEESVEEGVERGSVMVGGLGDPLSPGWGALEEGGERLGEGSEEVRRRFTGIVSLPVSKRVAEEVLRMLGGVNVPEEWGGKGKGFGVGPGPVKFNLTYLVGVLCFEMLHGLVFGVLCMEFGIVCIGFALCSIRIWS